MAGKSREKVPPKQLVAKIARKSTSATLGVKKSHSYRSGIVSLREIRCYQTCTELPRK